MLVLTRSIGERLFIQDGEIKIQVLEVKGNQVRLGIEAPKHIAIHREEVFDRIKTEGSAQKNNLVAQQEEAA
ncbi:MAG TPA: carbon storage regulator CsrA [Coxiellaceae bacterium]|nr:MAG: carbon storage regulator [Gammaproteobacteria bacterium RIFCSPHIGHO2_12_FULL_36_30]HLB55953.1 carbon storage regulator CsrA [Coxiellaceae bacterium]